MQIASGTNGHRDPLAGYPLMRAERDALRRETQNTEPRTHSSEGVGDAQHTESCVSPHPQQCGEDFVALVFAAAAGRPVPACARGYVFAGLRLLAGLCRELQAAQGERAFYLSCRDAARVLGVSHPTASRWLLRLEGDGVIRRVRRGSQGNQLASEYRYLGD